MPRIQCAEAIVDWLCRAGVRHVFLVPGAHISPLILALSRQNHIQAIACAHEESAAFMADGYARANQKIGVCLGIGGPGAANFLPGAVAARLHALPVLYLTGNSPTPFAGMGAFQDGGVTGSRDVALFEAAAGFSAMVQRPQELEPTLREVLRRFSGKPPQPAHVMLPYDLQLADYPYRIPVWSSETKPAPEKMIALYEGLLRTVSGAERVAILAGAEFSTPEASCQLREFAEFHQIPVAVTADAKGIFPHAHRLYLGVFGFGGGVRAAAALLDPELDALLILGAELDERNSLCWNARLLLGKRRLFQLRGVPLGPPDDCFNTCYVEADCEIALTAMNRPNSVELGCLTASVAARVIWIEALRTQPLEPCLPHSIQNGETGLHPATLVAEMRRLLPEDTTLFLDSGIHRLYAYHYWQTNQPSGLITAAKTAPVGWAIAAAIGAAFTERLPHLTVLTGDACMLMHGVELSTAAKYGTPILFIVSNNGAHGSIHQRLSPLCPSVENISRTAKVDWVAFARSLGVPAGKAMQASELPELIDVARQTNGPFLIEAITQSGHEAPLPEFYFTSCSEAVLQRFQDAPTQSNSPPCPVHSPPTL